MRKYSNYDEYIRHQSSKLNKEFTMVSNMDKTIEAIIFDRYDPIMNVSGSSVLCLGARLGGEVRAFKRMGALAIGIDLNPGKYNKDVLFGDFHSISFPDKSFDYVFSNCIDHVLEIDIFIKEIKRVLKDEGIVLMEIAIQKPGEYEVMDTSDISHLIDILLSEFVLIDEMQIDNGWTGKLMILKNEKDIY